MVKGNQPSLFTQLKAGTGPQYRHRTALPRTVPSRHFKRS
jgi:hypothetical protein